MESLAEQVKALSLKLNEHTEQTSLKMNEFRAQLTDNQRDHNQRIEALLSEQKLLRKEQTTMHHSLLSSHQNLEELVHKTVSTMARLIESQPEDSTSNLKTPNHS
ncbi:hypothetical protein M5689_020835 [Euphorbia peplus]|nr:hypothetical protein M5689_020835 [Euphorbia peplus]